MNNTILIFVYMSNTKESKKVVSVNETELINMINDLVETEVQKSKKNWLAEAKTKWISENEVKDASKVSILEGKLAKLEKLVTDKLK